MAQLLLDDAEWNPDLSLMDPYAGSGVFLLAAIDKAAAQGLSCRDVLPKLGAIDRSPAAYVALRTNLLLALARDPRGPSQGAILPIHCADSLLAAADAGAEETAPADVLLTNPPWVGWEYIPRTYRARLTAAWKKYDLFTAKGRDASFVKEDLSTLALVAAWDHYLKVGGVSSVVLRPAAMQSHLAGRGLRRLSLFADSAPLCLRRIRLFHGLRPFVGTDAPAAAWLLEKGAGSTFPIPAVEWRRQGRYQRSVLEYSSADVRRLVVETNRTSGAQRSGRRLFVLDDRRPGMSSHHAGFRRIEHVQGPQRRLHGRRQRGLLPAPDGRSPHPNPPPPAGAGKGGGGQSASQRGRRRKARSGVRRMGDRGRAGA